MVDPSKLIQSGCGEYGYRFKPRPKPKKAKLSHVGTGKTIEVEEAAKNERGELRDIRVLGFNELV
ncbi:MAG: hypothetical protein K2P81_01455 [Bacteriovoracaceae bacterium]|nr:hypothetical protein [Bacteriovoracaceae bacterium]